MRQHDAIRTAALCLVTACGAGAGAPIETAPRATSSTPSLAAPRSPPQPPALLTDGHYLPDWSFAGYAFGEQPLPKLAPTHSVLDFGAIPDDGRDDTAQFRAAVAEARTDSGPVVLRVPRGRYLLSNILFVERGDFVLQGEGSGANGSVLVVDRPLSEMDEPKRLRDLRAYLRDNDKRVSSGALFSPYSWTGGVVWTRSPNADQIPPAGRSIRKGQPLRIVEARRGEHELQIQDAAQLEVGISYALRWYNTEGDDSPLLQHVFGLHSREFGERLWDDPEQVLVEQDAQVLSVDGNSVMLKQPLLHDVRPGWRAELVQVERLRGVGIEHLRIQFPAVAYRGHHQEAGFNGLHLNDLTHSWVRDVSVANADSAVLSDRSSHVTLTGIRVEGRRGHYGVHLGATYGMLLDDFEIAPSFAHSTSFNTQACGSVVRNGVVWDGSLDQHRGANHQNLYDAIRGLESDDESRLFAHGGAVYWGPPHGAFNTFWNVSVQFMSPPKTRVALGEVRGAGPAYVIGLYSNAATDVVYEGAYFERMGEQLTEAPSLYSHQLATRLRQGGQRGSTPHTNSPLR